MGSGSSGRGLAPQVAQPMDQAALPHRSGETRLDSPDQPRGPVGDGEQRIGQAPALEVHTSAHARIRVKARGPKEPGKYLAPASLTQGFAGREAR